MEIPPTKHALAALAGISAHVLFFRVGEWDMASLSIFKGHVLALFGASMLSVTGYGVSVPQTLTIAGCYVAGLFSSMLVYRALFHRLKKYPGPFLAKLTNFYITARSIKKLHLYEVVQGLHAQYGDYVRLGPSELSITDPVAVQAIYGTQSPTSRGPWYTLLEPRTTMHMERDKREHARRRKIWDRGFSTKALAGYNHRITNAITDLLQVLDRNHGKDIDMTKWLSFYAFDVIEDLAFNNSPRMLHRGEAGYVFSAIRGDMFGIALFSHMPWLLPFLKRTPVLNKEYLRFWDYIQSLIDERVKNEPEQPDIFSWLLDEYARGQKTQVDAWNLHGDAQLIVIAGSDTSGAVLSHLFFELACDADLTRQLQADLDALPNLDHDELTKVDLLDAVINETLRLHPAVPSGAQRVTPPEGLQIGNEHIPGDTIVQVPSYTVFRDSRSFLRPDEFIAERWTSRPELIIDKSVFIPFSTGSSACVGKRLAFMEIRRATAEVLSRYNVRLASKQSREAFLDGKQDTFTLVAAPLYLNLSPRARGS